MNISYNWLKELINIELSPEETAAALTRVGLAVEGIHPYKDDLVFDIDLTSNRPDCLSHLGVARELSVSGQASTVNEGASADESDDDDAVPFPSVLAPEVVRIEAPELCRRFTARIIRGVKIGPSPQWLVDRLEALGERSINNVADITNFVMLELGQPMHAFDLDKLAENRIVVRTARAGETIKTLDEVEQKLDESMLMICDAEKPVAVAGVMGGIDSGITEATTNVLLEVAFFKRESIRQTSRKLGLATEASYRFERGVDIENLIRASDRATELILRLAGGTAVDVMDLYPTKLTPNEVASADISAAVRRLTGLDVPTDECVRILYLLGITSNHKNSGTGHVFTAPTWRHDIEVEEDLVEEVARHAGYENIGEELPPAYGAGEYQPNESRRNLLRQTLADQGFDEAITYSFIDTKHDGRVRLVPQIADGISNNGPVELRQSVIEGAVRMRPTLIPGLLDAARLNLNHQRKDVRLFEIGKVFASSASGELPHERELFGALLTGSEINEQRAMPVRELDFYDAKGAVESVLDAVGVAEVDFIAAEVEHLQRGQSAEIKAGDKVIGSVGRLNAEIAGDYKFKQPVYVAEIDLQTALAAATKPVVYAALPKYPSVVRDVSLLVKRDFNFSSISETIAAAETELRPRISFVDLYEGKGLEEDERSLTVRFEYRSETGTLTEEVVDAAHTNILEHISKSLGIRPRF